MQIETTVLIVMALVLFSLFRRLRSIEQGIAELLKMQGFGQGSLEPSEEVTRLVDAGRVVDAMRMYRQQCGADVRQARKVVDQLAVRAVVPIRQD